MRLTAALVGNLEQVMADERDEAARAITSGVRETTDDLKQWLRNQIVAAFGSQRLANTWRSATFPKAPQTSMGAAGTVWSNAPHIVEAFSASTVIRSKAGFFLAIPSPDAPKEYQYKRASPSNWNEARYGKLRFVYRPGRTSLLVVDGVKRLKSGRVSPQLANQGQKANGSYRAGASTVVMFFLVPYVRIKKLLDPEGAYDRALTAMAGNIIETWK